MRGVLTRIKGGQALRTTSVEGEFTEWPKVGESFRIVGKPLDPEASVRLVTTSHVAKLLHTVSGWVDQPNSVRFETQTGSVYEILERK